MNYIGVDPGRSGGVAVLTEGGAVVGAWPMPETERDVYDLIKEFSDSSRAVIEYVRCRPGQGAPGVFKFGWGYGGLRMALIPCAVPFVEVTPGKWQRAFSLTSSEKRTDTEKKNANKSRAQELFPGVRITHALADALLIAEYARLAL